MASGGIVGEQFHHPTGSLGSRPAERDDGCRAPPTAFVHGGFGAGVTHRPASARIRPMIPGSTANSRSMSSSVASTGRVIRTFPLVNAPIAART